MPADRRRAQVQPVKIDGATVATMSASRWLVTAELVDRIVHLVHPSTSQAMYVVDVTALFR